MESFIRTVIHLSCLRPYSQGFITLSHINIPAPAFGECIRDNLLDIHVIFLNVLPTPTHQLRIILHGDLGVAALGYSLQTGIIFRINGR